MKPCVGVTMGDPAGIGPEIICRSLMDKIVYEQCRPLVIGNKGVLEYAVRTLGLNLSIRSISKFEDARFRCGEIDVLDFPLNYQFEPGKMQRENGKVALDCIYKAVELVQAGIIDSICTAPTNKEAMKLAGSMFTGATELFAHLAGVEKASTVILQGGCYIFQLTTHVPLKDAISSITEDFLYENIMNANNTLKILGLSNARIALAGFNPHAGDGGLLGNEEVEIFLPAVNRLRREGVDISDPLPADTIFARGLKGDYDSMILLFHDTANIAIKLLSENVPAVVITSNLPFVRTTVAHGTAYDIAYKGIADYNQMKQAILAAAKICNRIKNNKK